MRRLFFRGALLLLPFVVLAAFVVISDPFNYFGISHVINDRVKQVTAGKLHYAMWKTHQFRRAPARNILLGDSRMDLLDTASIQRLAHARYFNFSYGGGTPVEAVETYWLVSREARLDAVYLEMGIINFNAFQILNRVTDVKAMDGRPLLYLSNRLVLRAAFLASYVTLTGDTVNVEAPSLDRSGFWRFQIDQAMPQLLHQYAYPELLASRLRMVAEDCKRRGTRFVIVIPPSHVDVQRKITELGRDADLARFKAFAQTLGTVYDFDYANELTSDSANFIDPFHLKNSDIIVRDIWSGSPKYARVTNRTSGG